MQPLGLPPQATFRLLRSLYAPAAVPVPATLLLSAVAGVGAARVERRVARHTSSGGTRARLVMGRLLFIAFAPACRRSSRP
jgi:hypothetical protein